MSLLALVIRLLLAIIFARAAWHKLAARLQFQRELAAYQLLPATLVALAAITLIALELLCAVTLLMPQRAGLALAAALLLLYAAAMAINLKRGRLHLDCGCSGPQAAKKTISAALVLRNTMLAGLALIAMHFSFPALALNSAALALLASLCAVLIYEASEQALANHQRYQFWRARQSNTAR